MIDQFDEPTKSLAQSVTRRAALKQFGVGLAGMALAAFWLADKAGAIRTAQGFCLVKSASSFRHGGYSLTYSGRCLDLSSCVSYASADCPAYGTVEKNTSGNRFGRCGLSVAYDTHKLCSFAV